MPCIPLQPVICPEVAKDYPSINSEASGATVELDSIVVGWKTPIRCVVCVF